MADGREECPPDQEPSNPNKESPVGQEPWDPNREKGYQKEIEESEEDNIEGLSV